jgi:hypothetical protein
MSMRSAVLLVAIAMAGSIAFFAARNASATAGSMTCGTSGGVYQCDWGYNYQGPSTNEIVTGTNAYWTHISVIVSSGGTTYQGFGPSGCHHTSTGTSSWSGSPADLGCSGYIDPFSQYHTGATSYLKFSSYV